MDLKSNDTVPLLEPQPELQQPNNKRLGKLRRYGFFLAFLFLYLNYHYVMAKYYRSPSNINQWDFALVTSCYYELMFLLCCLIKYENLMADSPTEDRDRLKGVMWVLCSLFTCTFTWRVSQTLPWYMKIIIWDVAVSLLVVGFYFFFLFQTEDAQLANKYCKLDTDDDEEEKKFSELSAEDNV